MNMRDAWKTGKWVRVSGRATTWKNLHVDGVCVPVVDALSDKWEVEPEVHVFEGVLLVGLDDIVVVDKNVAERVRGKRTKVTFEVLD